MRRLLALVAVAGLLLAFGAFNGSDFASAAKGGKGGGGGGGGRGEQTATMRYGPFTIPAATLSGPGQIHNMIAREGSCSWLTGLFAECSNTPIPPPCTNCYITGITPDLVDAGTDNSLNHMNGGMLHHVVNVNFGNNDPTCPPNLFGATVQQLGWSEGGNERWFASGNERTPAPLPPGYGYYVDSSDDWGLIFHIMNMTPQARTVEFKYTFTYVTKGVEPVQPIWFDIDQCNDSEVDMAAGYSDVHWDWTSTLTGTIIGIGGHVHDYGIDISLENVTQGTTICDSVAGYAADSPYAPVGPGAGDANHAASANVVTSDPLGLHNFHGHISDMTVCAPNAFIDGDTGWFDSGDLLRLHTQYYRPNATDHDMGIMIAYMDVQ